MEVKENLCEEACLLLKKLLNSSEFKKLKYDHRGYFYKAQDDLCRMARLGIGKPDIDFLNRCLDDPGGAIATLLPQSYGFDLKTKFITLKPK